MKTHKTILFVCLLQLWFSPDGRVYAQKQGRAAVDSLVAALPHTQDSMRVRILHEIAFKFNAINQDTGLLYGREGLALAQKLHWKGGQAACLGDIATLYRRKTQYSDALSNYFKALNLYQEIGNRRAMATIYGNIGPLYQYEADYARAIEYDSKCLELEKELGDEEGVAIALGDMGIVYWLMKRLDTALTCDFKALEILERKSNRREAGRTTINIALVYADLKQFGKAIEYDQKALSLSKQLDDQVNIGICYTNLGDIYARLADEKNLSGYNESRASALMKANAYLDSAIKVHSAIGENYNLLSTYKNKAEVAEAMGDFKDAYKSLKQYKLLNDSAFSFGNKVKLSNIAAAHELQLRQKQIELKKLEFVKNRNERWFFITGIVLLLTISLLVINRQRLRRKKLEAEKLNAESELDTAQKLLDNFRQSVLEKNQLLEQFSNEIAVLKSDGESGINDEVLAKLQQSTILTDEQWDDFQRLFEKVHKGFFRRVKEKMPDLTFTEVRFLALSKLKLSPREMASMLGISANSIRNYRLRLRRKLELDEDASIEEIADAI